MPLTSPDDRPKTRQQQFSQRAFECAKSREKNDHRDEYLRMARQFPALVHQCGLAQAVAFVTAKDNSGLLDDVAQVLGSTKQAFTTQARMASVTEYLRLTRNVFKAAEWLKRFAEALLADDPKTKPRTTAEQGAN